MKQEQPPAAVPRCDVIYELAHTFNELQDRLTTVQGQDIGTHVHDALQDVQLAWQEGVSSQDNDPDPLLTEFIGRLAGLSINTANHIGSADPFNVEYQVQTYWTRTLGKALQQCEDRIICHTFDHILEGACVPMTDAEPLDIFEILGGNERSNPFLFFVLIGPADTAIPRQRSST